MTRRTFFLLAALCACALVGAAQSGRPVGGPTQVQAVRTTVSDPERDYELRGVALSADGATTDLILATHPKGRPDEAGTLLWVALDDSGKVSSQRNPLGTLSATHAASVKTSPAAGSWVGLLGGKATLLFAGADGGIRSVPLARADGSAAIAASLDVGDRSPTIRRVLTKGSDHLVIVGSVGALPLVTEISVDGRTVAEYAPREEGLTAVGAAFESGSGAVVVAERGTFPDSVVWLGRVSARGEVSAKTVFPGRPYDIARAADGTLLVVFAKPSADGLEILIKGFASDLSERWTRTLMSRQRTGAQFRVMPVPGGGFVIAGVKDRGLWLSRVGSDGAEVWTEMHEPTKTPDLEMVFNVELASTQDIFVAAYTAFVVSGRQQRQVVRTIRFKAS